MALSLLIDFNAYFASVEQQLNPELRGRPVAVVPVMADSSSCIAASYEAKAYGIQTGTGVRQARKRCPELVLVLAQHEKYVRVHEQALAVIDRVVPIRQVLSIDEMECELTGRWCQRDHALRLAQRIKHRLQAELGTCLRTSIGIAPNTLLAKLASDMHKPDGLVMLEPHELPHRLYHLPITSFSGIGRRMQARLARCGILTVQHLYEAPRELLRIAWRGSAGSDMYDQLRGVRHAPRSSAQHSLGHSHMLPPHLRQAAGALAVVHRLVQKAAMRLRKQGLYCAALSVHVMPVGSARSGFVQASTQLAQTQDTALLLHTVNALWQQHELHRVSEPLSVGIVLHGLVANALHTPDLFEPETAPTSQGPLATTASGARRSLLQAVDALNRKHGKNTVYFASAHAGLDHAPMRIAFNRIPDLDSER